jgi:hypothetical protein
MGLDALLATNSQFTDKVEPLFPFEGNDRYRKAFVYDSATLATIAMELEVLSATKFVVTNLIGQ